MGIIWERKCGPKIRFSAFKKVSSNPSVKNNNHYNNQSEIPEVANYQQKFGTTMFFPDGLEETPLNIS